MSFDALTPCEQKTASDQEFKIDAVEEDQWGQYDPNRLLDALIARMRLKNDVALCRVLDVNPPLISKIRSRVLPVSAALLIRMHDVSGLSIFDLRTLMGDRRSKYRVGLRGAKARKIER